MPFLPYIIIILVATVSSEMPYTVSKYSLEDIFTVALKNSSRLKIIKNNADANLQKVEIYRAEAFPRIDFNTSIGYASQSLLGQQFESATSVDRIKGFLSNWFISLEQPVFKFGQIFHSLKLATLSKKYTSYSTDLQKNDFFMDVIEQFTQAYIGQFQYLISDQSYKRSQRISNRTSLDFESGHISKLQLLRAQASLEGYRASLLTSESNRRVYIKKLNVLIGLPDSADYSLVLDTCGELLKLPSQSDQRNLLVILKGLESEINTYLRKNAWSSFFPSLSLTGSIFNEFMAVDTTGLTEKFIESQPSGEFVYPEIPVTTDYFNPDLINYSIGLKLNWNIFDGKRSWAQYKQSKLVEKTSRLELEQMERENSNNVLDLRNQINAIDNTISAYRLQFEASQKALKQADMDFQDGFIDAVTYLEIEEEYKNAAMNLDNGRLQQILLHAQLRVALGLSIYGE